MKCTTVIDPNREDEEVVIYLKKEREIAHKIEALLLDEGTDLVGYGSNGQIIPLSPSDVLCFTVEGGKVFALTEHERLLLKCRLYTLEEQLQGRFVKINQSCLINVSAIERFDTSFGGTLLVTLKNGFRDYVSRRQMKAVKERLGLKK